MVFEIYKHTNKVNGKCYIGITSVTMNDRWKEHIRTANSGSQYKFHRAIRKYGPKSFEHELIGVCDNKEDAIIAEQFNIIKHDSFNSGYNRTFGGDGFNGRHSEDAKNKMSVAKLGKPRSIKIRRNMSLALMGNKNPNFGKHHSEETKRKMSESAKTRRKKI